jgi:putative SOS response-associated peptidase YedK
MCARYYVDDELSKQIEKVLSRINTKIAANVPKVAAKDIYPANEAPILSAHSNVIECKLQHWGFKSYHGKQVIFNARSETALEKPTFRESVKTKRAVIPATQFYEWSPAKEKFIFRPKDSPLLYMAGCYRRYEDGDHFVIFTTAANASLKSVHDRMPLLIEQDDIEDWIMDDSKTESFLQKVPALLECSTDYEQMSLFS